MAVEEKIVHLTRQQLAYLREGGFLVEKLLQILDSAEPERREALVVQTSSRNAEQFRAAFTDRLAQIGFDLDYALTSEGELLEDLIDRFG